MKTVIIYTDGACRGNPGPGGWGVLIEHGELSKQLYGGVASTTNNKMELTAAIMALREFKEPCEVILYTDSKYVINGIEEWIHNWKKRGWIGSNKKSVKNIKLWKELDELRQEHTIKWNWVKGHSGDPGNETADMLANRGIDEL